MTSRAKVVVVLGMHRSGTSAVARGLQVLGVELGDRLMPAHESGNAKGYWEDLDINELNVRMLHALGMDWHTLAPVQAHQVRELDAAGFLREAAGLLREKVAKGGCFGFKDPRVSKLLPVWRAVFSQCGLDARFILAIRHPQSVAISLARRDGFSPEKCNLLWLVHVLESLGTGLDGALSIIVDYDRLMASPERELHRISTAFGLPVDERQLRLYADEFIDETLRHARHAPEDLEVGSTRPPLIKDIYRTLLALAADEGGDLSTVLAKQLTGWRADFAQVWPALVLADDLWGQHAALLLDVRAKEAALQTIREELADKALQVDNLSRAVSEYVKSIQGLQITSMSRDRQVAGLGNLVADRERRVKELVDQIGTIEAALAGTVPVMDQHTEEIHRLGQSTREMTVRIESLIRDVDMRDQLVVRLEKAGSALHDRIVALDAQIVGKDRAIAQLNAAAHALELQLRSSRMELSSSVSENAALRQDLQVRDHKLVEVSRDMARQMEAASARQSELVAQAEEARQALQAREAQVTVLSQRLQDRETTVGNLSRAVSEYAGVVASMNEQRVARDKDITHLSAEVASCGKKLEDLDLILRAQRAELLHLRRTRWVRVAIALQRRFGVDLGMQAPPDPEELHHRAVNPEQAVPVVMVAATIDGLLQVPEARFLDVLYRTVLQRPSDSGGSLHYRRLLARGVSRLQVAVDVATSSEARHRGQSLAGIEDLFYLLRVARIPVIGRKLLPAVFFEPSAHPRAASALPLDVDTLIRISSDEAFLAAAYRIVLHRTPDYNGSKLYLGRLQRGASRLRVLGDLVGSHEAASLGNNSLLWRAQIGRRRMAENSWLAWWLPDVPTRAQPDQRQHVIVPSSSTNADLSVAQGAVTPRPDDTRSWWKANIRKLAHPESDGPLISIVMPVYKTPLDLLRMTIASVLAQDYTKWELCICNDGSNQPELDELLLELSVIESRVKYVSLPCNMGIAAASNKAMRMAKGEFIALLDHDDELTNDALSEVVFSLAKDPRIDVVYSDQDKTNSQCEVIDTFFKPDWSPDFFRRVMYVGHLLVVRTELARRVGGFDTRFDRVQDYEFMLRVSEQASKVFHLPKILYHWRAIEGSIAATTDAKGGIESLQCLAVHEHLSRLGIAAKVEPHAVVPHRAVVCPVQDWSGIKVSIIIPSKNHPEHIGRCLESIFGKSTHSNLEVIVVDNGTTDPEALAILRRFPVIVVPFNERFNYSKANNLGAARATGDVLVLLNNDTEVVTGNWLELLLDPLQQSDVGIVGPMLLYPDGSVQHAGIVIGPRGTADHVMRGFRGDSDGYAGSLSCVREVSGITGACLMVRKATYDALGGLSELYGTHYQDVDFCLAVRRQGSRILHVPQAQLVHHESASRGSDYDFLDRLLLQDSWHSEIAAGDPYFNPAFSLQRLDYSLAGDGGSHP